MNWHHPLSFFNLKFYIQILWCSFFTIAHMVINVGTKPQYRAESIVWWTKTFTISVKILSFTHHFCIPTKHLTTINYREERMLRLLFTDFNRFLISYIYCTKILRKNSKWREELCVVWIWSPLVWELLLPSTASITYFWSNKNHHREILESRKKLLILKLKHFFSWIVANDFLKGQRKTLSHHKAHPSSITIYLLPILSRKNW